MENYSIEEIQETKMVLKIFYRWLKSKGMYYHFIKEFIPARKDSHYANLTLLEYALRRTYKQTNKVKKCFFANLIDRSLVYSECELDDITYNELNTEWERFFYQNEIERLLSRALSSI